MKYFVNKYKEYAQNTGENDIQSDFEYGQHSLRSVSEDFLLLTKWGGWVFDKVEINFHLIHTLASD